MGLFENLNSNTEDQSKQAMDYSDAQEAPRDVYDQIGNADVQRGGTYPEPGLYPCIYINVLKMTNSRKGDTLFIAELDIISSNVDSRPAGTTMSWICNLTKHDAAPGNVRGFLAALMGVNISEVDGPASRIACSDRNPCHGRLVRLEATHIQTKAGNDFTLCSWTPIEKEHQDKAEEIRADAGFSPF